MGWVEGTPMATALAPWTAWPLVGLDPHKTDTTWHTIMTQ